MKIITVLLVVFIYIAFIAAMAYTLANIILYYERKEQKNFTRINKKLH
jgi:hypothetical protein